MVSTRSGRKVTVNIPAAVSKKSVVDKVRKAAKQVIKKEVRKVNNNSNNNSNNASNVSNNNKPKRVYVCGDKCKAQKRRIVPGRLWKIKCKAHKAYKRRIAMPAKTSQALRPSPRL